MVDLSHQLDPGRPVTAAMNGGWGKGFSSVVDVQGCNYFNESFDKFHRAFPNKPMLFTETSSAVSDRGIYLNDWNQARVGSYTNPVQDQWPDWVTRTEESWQPIADKTYLSGAFVWTGFDYRGEPSPYGWPNVSSHFGILDLCGFPKDVYYYYKAWWSDQPSVHITPHWNWPGETNKPKRVLVFANTASVELFQDGKSLGRQSVHRNGHVEWTVVYRQGELIARGYDEKGRLVSTDRVRTADKPSRIVLHSDLQRLQANHLDMSVIEAEVVDSDGNPVPDATNNLEFQLQGNAASLVGTGNGDPNDHMVAGSSIRPAFSGKAIGMARSTGKTGKVTVMVSSTGLKPAKLSLEFH